MRKSRLKILPARCLSRLGFLLLYLACPVIGDMSRTRPWVDQDLLLLQRLSAPDNPGDGELPDNPGHHGGAVTCHGPLPSAYETSVYDGSHCIRLGIHYLTRDAPVITCSQNSRNESFRAVHTDIHETPNMRFLQPASKSASNENKESTGVVDAALQTWQENYDMFRDNRDMSEPKHFRSNTVTTESRRVQRLSPNLAGVRRVSRIASPVPRKMSDKHPGTRRTLDVRSNTRILRFKRTSQDIPSESRRFSRYNTRLSTTETRREKMGTRISPNDSRRKTRTMSITRRSTGDISSTRAIRTYRRLSAVVPNTRRLQRVTSFKRTNSVNTYRDARTTTSTNRRLYRDRSDTRNIHLKVMSTPHKSLLARRVSQETSTNRRISVKIFKVSDLDTETVMSEIHPINPLNQKCLSNTNNDSVSMSSQNVTFLRSYSDEDFNTRLFSRDDSSSRKLSTVMPKTQKIFRKSYLVRGISERTADSRSTRISRVNKIKLSAEVRQTRRLIRVVPAARRNIADVYQSERISRTAFKNKRTSYNLSEMRRKVHGEVRARRYSEDVSGKTRSSRIHSMNRRLSLELPTKRTISRKISFTRGNAVAAVSTRRLSLATASSVRSAGSRSSRVSVGTISVNKILGEFIATERLNREQSLVRRNPSVMSESRRMLTSRSSVTRRKNPVDAFYSRRVPASKPSVIRQPIEVNQRRQLVRRVTLTRDNIREPYLRRISRKSNVEQREIRSLVRETREARKFSSDSLGKRRSFRATSSNRISIELPEARRKSRELSLARRYSADNRESNRQFRVASMFPALHSGLHERRMLLLEQFLRSKRSFDAADTRRMLLAAGSTKASRENPNRRSVVAVSKKVRLDTEFISRQRFVRESLSGRVNSAATRSSKLATVSSINTRFFSKKTDSRKLSRDEHSKYRIFTNKLRSATMFGGRFMERRLSAKLSKIRNSNNEASQAIQNSIASSTERTRFISDKSTYRKQSRDGTYLTRISGNGFFTRRLTTEQQRSHRISVPRRISALNLDKRIMTTVRSGNKLHFSLSRSLQDAYKTRKTFGYSSARRFSTARSSNRRVLLRNYVEASSAKMSIMTATRRTAVSIVGHTISKTPFDNQLFSSHLPYIEMVPEPTHNMKSKHEDSPTPALLKQTCTATTRISEGTLVAGMNMTAVDILRDVHFTKNFGRITSTCFTSSFFIGDSNRKCHFITDTSLPVKASQQCTNSFATYHAPSQNGTLGGSEVHRNIYLFSRHSKQTKVPEGISVKDVSTGGNEDAHAIVSIKNTNSMFSAAVSFGINFLMAWLAPLSEKLSNSKYEHYLEKFLMYNSNYDIFQDMMEPISQLNIMQIMKNSHVPDVGDSGIPISLPDDTTGPGLVNGGLVGTALLLSTTAKK